LPSRTPKPASGERTHDAFVARQPILDRRQSIAAYELLFRDGAAASGAAIDQPSRATARVAIDTFVTMGTASVLGDRRGFLNADLELLASEALEALPTEQIVLEVLESVPAWAHARCLELRRAGFALALDDYVPGDPRRPMLDAADFVKVDLVLTPGAELPALVRELRDSGAQLVAEKVETRDDFQRCLDLGFDFFQGYYFAKPVTLSARRHDPERTALLEAFRALSEDTEVVELENCFKRHTDLGIHVLRFANSAGMGSRTKIATLQHAIMYLGIVPLRRWVLLMLYGGSDASAGAGPLAELAAVRGRLLELLLDAVDPELASQVSKECAFLAGMLSLADALLERDLGEVIDELRVDPVIREATLERRGTLGLLLRAVECLEQGNFTELAERLREAGMPTEALADAQREAYGWIRNVYRDIGGVAEQD
jgi:EAL and modified HD-GYP domain-containing signal transduction protein